MNKRATEYDLNDSQLEQLIDKYVDTIVDSMSMKDLQVYVMDDMTEYMHELTFSDVLNEIKYTLVDGYFLFVPSVDNAKCFVSFKILKHYTPH